MIDFSLRWLKKTKSMSNYGVNIDSCKVINLLFNNLMFNYKKKENFWQID